MLDAFICCFCISLAYNDFGLVHKSVCVPRSLTFPFSITKISSASDTVLKRCAIHILVRPVVARLTASRIF